MADSSSKPVQNGQSDQNVGGSAPQPQNQTGLMAVPPHQNWNQQTQNWNQQTPNWNQGQWNVPSFNNWNHPPPPFPQPPLQFSQQFGPPQNFGPPQQHRQTNNIWGDPNLYQPYFSGYQSGPPPGGPPRGGFGHHQNRGGFNRGGGRGRGGGNGGRNQGQNGGDSQPNSSGNQRGGGRPNFQNSGGNFNNGRGGQNNQGNNGNQGKNKKKKERVDKRDLPENNVFHCEVCDRGFPTDAKYKEHVDQHEKCPIKECAYVAASRLVEIHYNVQHRTGVAKKIWNIKSSEEIKQWIEERKKNFPTKEKVEKKRKDFAERKQRGETIQSKNFGKMKDSRGEPGSFQRGRGRGGRGGRGGGQGHGGHRGRSDNDQSAFGENSGSRDAQSKRGRDTDNNRMGLKRPADESSTASSPKKSKQNSGQRSQESVDPLSLLIQGNGDSPGNSDDDDVSGNKRGTAVLPNPEVRCGGLANLIASYDSDDDSEEEGRTKEGKSKKDEEDAVEETPEEVSSKDSASFKRPLTDPNHNSAQSGRKNRKHKHGQNNQQQQRRPNRRPSLLEMLLAKEIRHERNLILQCVHHIVKNKFFGIGQGKITQVIENGAS